MLSAEQVLDEYFLQTRSMLLEIAATLDRYDVSDQGKGRRPDGSNPRLDKIYQSLAILADKGAGTDRAERLLRLFSDPVD